MGAMLASGASEQCLPGRGRGLVADRDLPAGLLAVMSPALAVSSTADGPACAFCFATFAREAAVRCDGGCGLAWCGTACQEMHAAGYSAEGAPLLRAAPHTAALCQMLTICGGDQDSRLVLEALGRFSAPEDQDDRPAEMHASFIARAAQLMYCYSGAALQESLHDLRAAAPAARSLGSCVDELPGLVSHHQRSHVPRQSIARPCFQTRVR